MIKLFVWLIGFLLLLYIVVCLFFFLFQEQLIFYPQKLPSNTRFAFPYEFNEYFIEVEEGVKLNGLLFKAENRQDTSGTSIKGRNIGGLIFYLHGNAGALNSWGYAAEEFLNEGYDVFILDYRGYGKSEGKISSQKQLFSDVEKVFLEMKELYQEQKIIIAGFSVGTGPACWLAARYTVDMLILIAPFFNMNELASRYFPFLPFFILRYPLKNNRHINNVEAPVVLIHGKEDEIVPYESSIRLKEEVKTEVRLFILEGLGHNNISGSPDFQVVLRKVLP